PGHAGHPVGPEGARRRPVGEERRAGGPGRRPVLLLHLVGDLHQPLHSTQMFAALFPNGDQGGNLFGLRVNGRKVNLHAYWDNILYDDPDYRDESAEHHAKLYQKVKELTEQLRAPEYGRDKLPELTKNTTFPAWAQESHEVCKEVVYGKLT